MFTCFLIITSISCGKTSNISSYTINDKLQFKQKLEGVSPYISIHNGYETLYQQDIAPWSTYDISIDNINPKSIDVLKKIYWKGAQLDVITTNKDKVRGSNTLFRLKSDTFNWTKELQFGDVQTNNDGFLYISDKNLGLFDIETGDLKWNVPFDNLVNNNGTTYTQYLFIQNDSIIVKNEAGSKYLDTKNGKYSEIFIEPGSENIENSNGFIYKGHYYFVDKERRLIKYPETVVCSLNSFIDYKNRYYISMFGDNIALMELDKDYISAEYSIFMNLRIFKPNVDVDHGYGNRLNYVLIINLGAEDDAKTKKIDNCSISVAGDYLIVYEENMVSCFNNKLNPVWELDLREFDNRDQPKVLYTDNNIVIISTNTELFCYKLQ